MPQPYFDEVKKGRWNSAFFDTVGDESGNICMHEFDGSVTPVEFRLTAPPDQYFYVHQFTGNVRCNRNLKDDGFGAGPALENGLILINRTAAGDRVMTNQKPIKENMDFGVYSFWTVLTNKKTLVWKFQITDDGTSFRLSPGDSLVWLVRDDLTKTNRRIVCMHMRAGMIAVPKMYK
jgi:hypothetical protein